jgi:glucokinase
MILAGDVGGTKTRLGLFAKESGGLKRLDVERYESGKFPSLEKIIENFLINKNVKIEAACFGIPGPVIDGTVKVTNLPWEMSEKDIAAELSIPKVRLVNDLAATAAAVPHFKKEDLLTLREGRPLERNGVAAVIAPGTGMGTGILHMLDGVPHVLPSEGGHANFAPTNEIEIELLKYMKQHHDHVSVEHLICGSGMVNIYNFLRDTGYAEEPQELRDAMAEEAPAPVITKFAQEKKFEICVKTLDMFVHMLGAHCSNLMLSVMATSGIYLGGGVPPKIIEKLKDGTIIKSYLAKGKMQKTVEKAALHVIKDDHAALMGAAHIANSL